jgi:hypothetical protein
MCKCLSSRIRGTVASLATIAHHGDARNSFYPGGPTPVIGVVVDYVNSTLTQFTRELVEAYSNIPWANTVVCVILHGRVVRRVCRSQPVVVVAVVVAVVAVVIVVVIVVVAVVVVVSAAMVARIMLRGPSMVTDRRSHSNRASMTRTPTSTRRKIHWSTPTCRMDWSLPRLVLECWWSSLQPRTRRCPTEATERRYQHSTAQQHLICTCKFFSSTF